MTNRYAPVLLLPTLITLAGGCHGNGADESSGADTSSPDVETADFDVAVSLSGVIPTVVVVDWSVALEGVTAARVEYGADTTYGRVATANVDSSPYRTLVLGLKPDTKYHLRVVATTAEGEFVSNDSRVTTGPVLAAMPNLSVESSGSHWEGYLVTGLVATDAGPIIIDPDGDYVWWYAIDRSAGGGGGGGGGVVLGRSHLALDGSAMLYTYCNVEGARENAIYRVSMDGTEAGSVSTPYGHHDFVELPDGTFGYLAYDPRQVDGERILGDHVMEVTPDGTTREVYNIWDHYTFTSGEDLAHRADWPHANAIDYLPEKNVFLVSFLKLDAILEIDRSTGETLWTMGGSKSDFTLDGSTDLFEGEHQFEREDQSMVVFVNGPMEADSQSRAVEYAFQDDGSTVREVWSYWPKPAIRSPSLGDVHRFADGDTLVTFSVAGVIHEVDNAGNPVWKLTAQAGGALGYTTWKSDLDVGSW
jgi:hypothetical protein